MGLHEKRREMRIARSQLPEHYQAYTIVFKNESFAVLAYDASITGFSFLSSLSADMFLIGQTIIAHPIGSEFPLQGVVRYAASTPDGTHVGLSLLVSEMLLVYQQIISPLLSSSYV